MNAQIKFLDDHAMDKIKCGGRIYVNHARPRAFKSYLAIEEYGWSAELKVDFDHDTNPPDHRKFKQTLDFLKACGGVKVIRAFGFTTRKGSHLRAWISAQLSDDDILKAHEVIGDDPIRQKFNAARVERGAKGWLVLWTSKRINGRLVSSETFSPEWTEKFRKWLKVKS